MTSPKLALLNKQVKVQEWKLTKEPGQSSQKEPIPFYYIEGQPRMAHLKEVNEKKSCVY
jgi:hypothetical protein